MRQLGAAIARERAHRIAQWPGPWQLELRRRHLVLAGQEQERRKRRLLGDLARPDHLRDRLDLRRAVAGECQRRVGGSEIDSEDLHSSTSAGAITARSTPSASAGSLASTTRQPWWRSVPR